MDIVRETLSKLKHNTGYFRIDFSNDRFYVHELDEYHDWDRNEAIENDRNLLNELLELARKYHNISNYRYIRTIYYKFNHSRTNLVPVMVRWAIG